MKKIVLISPNFSLYRGGNTTSTLRIFEGLKHAGIAVQIYDLREPFSLNDLRKFDSPQYLLHAFNLLRCASFCEQIQKTKLVVSITGTDFEQQQTDPRFDQIARKADQLICQNSFQYESLQTRYSEKLILIHKGILSKEMLTSGPEIPLNPSWKHKKICFYPAGLRPVKGQLLYLQAIQTLSATFPDLLWLFAGACWEKDYAETFLHRIQSMTSVQYLGDLDYSQMGHLYQKSFVLLNGSITEGLPNTILEAGQWEIPVLCRRNSGNLSATDQGRFATLFTDEQDFPEVFSHFYHHYPGNNPKFREWIQSRFSVQEEIKKLIFLYERLS